MINQLAYSILLSFAILTSACNGQINKKIISGSEKQIETNTKEPIRYGAGDIVTNGILDRNGNM